MKFIHQVSKGSRYNQVYVPRSMEESFQVGDVVEVRLIEKKQRIHLSKTLKQISDFKRKLITQIFSELSEIDSIKKVFVAGSFLTEKTSYNDIDVLIIIDKEGEENLDKRIYDLLTDKLEMKFHILIIQSDNFSRLVKICPLTRSMLHYYASNKEFFLPKKTEIDKKHLEFLLMMPEDLLEISISSRAYYDALRRLIAIEKFLSHNEADNRKIAAELEKQFGKSKLVYIKNNEPLNGNILEDIREIMRNKLNFIRKTIGKR